MIMISLKVGRSPEDKRPVPELAVRVSKAAKMLDISERKLFDLTKAGEIRCQRVGRCVLYSVEELRRFIEGPEPE